MKSILAPFDKVKRKFVVSSVDVDTGEYMAYTEKTVNLEEIPYAALASGSIPAVFPPMHFDGRYLMDGGTVWNTNANTAVNKCRDMGYDDEKIIVDVVSCHFYEEPETVVSNNAFENWMVARSIKEFYMGQNALFL